MTGSTRYTNTSDTANTWNSTIEKAGRFFKICRRVSLLEQPGLTLLSGSLFPDPILKETRTSKTSDEKFPNGRPFFLPLSLHLAALTSLKSRQWLCSKYRPFAMPLWVIRSIVLTSEHRTTTMLSRYFWPFQLQPSDRKNILESKFEISELSYNLVRRGKFIKSADCNAFDRNVANWCRNSTGIP